MFQYNQGRCFSAVMCNPNGRGYVVTATNIELGQTIEVSDPILCIQDATEWARKFAGVPVERTAADYDRYDQWLSERLGF